jgi:serpin B
MNLTNKSVLASLLLSILFISSSCTFALGPKVLASDKPRITNPVIPAEVIDLVVTGNNSFALDFYHSLSGGENNLIFSPYSLSLALAMTYAGARSETASQMEKVMHFDLPQQDLHPAFNSLDRALLNQTAVAEQDSEPFELHIANAIWAEQTYPFLQSFLDLLSENYGAGINLADFINAHEAEREKINSWVENQTRGKITDLIPAGILDELTRMVLVNAIYFKADWQLPFDKDSTHDATFHLPDDTEIQVPMMSQSLFNVPYGSGNNYQAIELVYTGNTAAMDILVPNAGKFTDFEAGLNTGNLTAILDGLEDSSVLLSLPKFSYTSEINLSSTLQDMGMHDAFNADRADFTGMSDRRELYISDVLHKAFVAVDEEGTEAAAASAVVMGVTSAQPSGIVLTIDRPFIFLIRDLQTGQILFMGRVTNPLESE